MEFLIVSENKLKIMLDSEEMRKYKLEKEELDYSDSAVRTSFWKILDEAKAACGFDAKGEKVLIQFYPSKNGGEIFITKLGKLSKSAERSIQSSGRVAMLESETKIYKFENLSDLICAFRVNREYIPEDMKLYRAPSGEFYLVFELRAKKALSLSEFASDVPSSIEFYIKEHANIVDDGFSTLTRLADIG